VMGAPTAETKVEPKEFEFSWMENGSRKTTKISAEFYELACWKLGLLHQDRFARFGVPKDFELVLDKADHEHEAKLEIKEGAR
jgi:hypothetical protein